MSDKSMARVVTDEFIASVKGFPKHVYIYIVAMVAAILSDIILTSLALAGVATGLALNWEAGAAVFFSLYFLSRVAGSVANAIGSTGQNITIGLTTAAGMLAEKEGPPEA